MSFNDDFLGIIPLSSVVSGTIAVHNNKPIWIPANIEKHDAIFQG